MPESIEPDNMVTQIGPVEAAEFCAAQAMEMARLCQTAGLVEAAVHFSSAFQSLSGIRQP